MAYIPVPNASTGDKFTAAYVNAYLRDNFAASVPDIFTAKGQLAAATGADAAAPVTAPTVNGQVLTADSTVSTGMAWKMPTDNQVIDAKGDLIVGSAADTMARLAVGGNNDLLIADSTAANGVKWWNVERVFAGANGAQVLYAYPDGANSAEVQITLDYETLDTKSSFSSSTFTAKTAGKFYVRLSGRVYDTPANGSAENLYLAIKKNGTTCSILDYRMYQWGVANFWLGGCDIVDMAAGDALTFYVYYSRRTSSSYIYLDQQYLQITQIP